MLPATIVALAALALRSPAHGFVPDTDRYVSLYRGEDLLVGRLDKEGHFNELERFGINQTERGVYRFNTPYGLLNGRRVPEPVYEFRYGRLVPGTMRKGNFTPDPAGKSVRFADYHYRPDARPIWNLPGYFRCVYPIRCSDKPAAALAGATIIVGEPISKTDRQHRMQELLDERRRIRERGDKIP